MPESEVNPYAAPASTPVTDVDPRQAAIDLLRGPSLGLLVMCVPLGALGVLWFIVFGLLETARAIGWFPWSIADPVEVLQVASALPSCFTAYGAWCMRRGVRYRWAIAAAILASIPFLSPCIWLGIPFGVWALVVLRRNDVRAAFTANAYA